VLNIKTKQNRTEKSRAEQSRADNRTKPISTREDKALLVRRDALLVLDLLLDVLYKD
jgi:hypothetical protein